MAGGAFQTSREIFDNPIWQDVPKFRIFFFIVGNAVFAAEGLKKGNILIQRGQFLRSYRNLQHDLEYIENRAVKQYSLSVLKRKIEALIKEERLKIEDTELGTLFTVVNYDMYQGFDHYKKPTLGTALERTENRDGTGMEQGWNNNNNVNKDKKEKKKEEDGIISLLIKNHLISPGGITQTLKDDLGDIYDNFDFDDTDSMIKEAIKDAVRGKGQTWKFVYNKLWQWKKQGLKNVQALQESYEKKIEFRPHKKNNELDWEAFNTDD